MCCSFAHHFYVLFICSSLLCCSFAYHCYVLLLCLSLLCVVPMLITSVSFICLSLLCIAPLLIISVLFLCSSLLCCSFAHHSGRSSGLHPISSHSCWMYVHAGRPAFARPYVGVHKSTSLMSSSLLLQQCPACLVHLTWIVFVIGGRWLHNCV